jgi:NAD(P)H-dependent flavin oxidoreductase YrpB (nitropropane dioxygenase family)
MDPDNLPEADPSKMDFDKAATSGAKAWKDIWGSGQGIGAVKEIAPVADLVGRLAALAQLVEHIIRNDGVTCSSHVSGTTFRRARNTGNSG